MRGGGGGGGGDGGGRGGREANRKAPSVSVTGALLTGNFFWGQVVSSRHATNQAGRAAGSDYKKGRDCADMFIRSHKLWCGTRMPRYAYAPEGKVREIIPSHCTFFGSLSCAVSRALGRERTDGDGRKRDVYYKRFTFEAKCVEL